MNVRRAARPVYSGNTGRPSELATRLVDEGVKRFAQEGMPEHQARQVMRATIGQVFGEWGADHMYVPKDLAFDGLTQRDREIWAAWNGNNRHELCQRFDLSPRMLDYVLAHCRRWHRENTQPQLPGLEQQATPEQAP